MTELEQMYAAQQREDNRRTAWIVRCIKAATLTIAGMFILTAPVGRDNGSVALGLGLTLIVCGAAMFLIKP